MNNSIKGPHKSIKTICYINTDLDIKSDGPFDNLVKYFKKAGIFELHYHKEKKGLWSWSGEVETRTTHNKTPADTIRKFIKILNAFGPDELKEWNKCKIRIFNIGYDCGDHPCTLSHRLSSQSIEQISKLGAGIEITIYAQGKKRKTFSN